MSRIRIHCQRVQGKGAYLTLMAFGVVFGFGLPVQAAQFPVSTPATRNPWSQCTPDWQTGGCQAPRGGSRFSLQLPPLVAGADAAPCREPPCALAEVPSPGTASTQAAPAVSRPSRPFAATSGPGNRVGYYFLGTIPVIVGVGSLLGIDHRLHYDNTGIWKRSDQKDLEYGVIAAELAGGLYFGGQSRLGRTFWQSIDASAFSAITVQALKYTFSRARPYQSSSPGHWFQGGCCQSFPSGEVTLQASVVTPFILEYHTQHPWVWALEALPLYDAIARMKTQGHWQTDVLAGWALGTAFGIFAHHRKMPFILGFMPHGIMVGWHTSF